MLTLQLLPVSTPLKDREGQALVDKFLLLSGPTGPYTYNLCRSPNTFAQDFASPGLKQSMFNLVAVITGTPSFPSSLQVSYQSF